MTTQVKTPETDVSHFISRAFALWRASDIDFLILRNYDKLPFEPGNDVDVLISPADIEKAKALLVKAARETGFQVHNAARFVPLSVFFYHEETGEQLQFDLFDTLTWRGFPILETAQVLAAKCPQDTFFTPHPAHEAALNLLSRLLYQGHIKEAYKAGIREAAEAHGKTFQALLSDMLGPALAARIMTQILAADWDSVVTLKASIRNALVRRQIMRAPTRTVIKQWGEMWRLFKRFKRPPGLLVALIGPDGSGKSSLAEGLMSELATSFKPDKSLYVHWKPSVLTNKASRGVVTDPHAMPVRTTVLSLLYFVFHSLDFFLGGWLRLRPVLFRNGLVAIDRYYYDFFVDQRRFRLKVPKALVWLAYRFIQKPDLVLYLDAPSDVLHSRKQELSLEETERQRQAYLRLSETLSNAYVIDASQPLDRVIRRGRDLALAYLAERTEKQFR